MRFLRICLISLLFACVVFVQSWTPVQAETDTAPSLFNHRRLISSTSKPASSDGKDDEDSDDSDDTLPIDGVENESSSSAASATLEVTTTDVPKASTTVTSTRSVPNLNRFKPKAGPFSSTSSTSTPTVRPIIQTDPNSSSQHVHKADIPASANSVVVSINTPETNKESKFSVKEGSAEEDSDGDDEEDTAESEALMRNGTRISKEEESLLKLQTFLQNSVETALKSVMPLLVRSSYETNVSSQCASSFLNMMRALQGGKQWAYASKFTKNDQKDSID